MSTPYGQQPPAPPPGPSRPSRSAPDLGGILALAAATLGLIIYICSFAASALVVRGSFSLVLVLGAGLLGAATLLPSVSRVLVPAAVLSALGSLTLISVVGGSVPDAAAPIGPDGSTPGIVITMLVLSILQTGALVAGVLIEAGIIRVNAGAPARPQSSGAPPPAPQPPAPQGQYPPGQYAPPPGHYQYPSGQYGQPGPSHQPQYGQPAPPQQGQYGQPAPPQQGQPAPPGAYGQYEQRTSPSGQPDHGEGTIHFSPSDLDELDDQDEPGQQDLRRRYGPPDGGSRGRS